MKKLWRTNTGYSQKISDTFEYTIETKSPNINKEKTRTTNSIVGDKAMLKYTKKRIVPATNMLVVCKPCQQCFLPWQFIFSVNWSQMHRMESSICSLIDSCVELSNIGKFIRAEIRFSKFNLTLKVHLPKVHTLQIISPIYDPFT